MKRTVIIIVHNTLVSLILVALWLLIFLGSEYWKILPPSELAAIFMICMAFMSFLFINWRLFRDRHILIRFAITVFISTMVIILWYSTSTIIITMVSIRLSIPVELFFKNSEPLTNILWKLDNSAEVGLIFALVLFFAVGGSWYWVLFMGGAQKWHEGIIQYNEKFGPVDKESFMLRPVVLKASITIMLLAGLFMVYAAFTKLTSK